jgi:hypothetical protein
MMPSPTVLAQMAGLGTRIDLQDMFVSILDRSVVVVVGHGDLFLPFPFFLPLFLLFRVLASISSSLGLFTITSVRKS